MILLGCEMPRECFQQDPKERENASLEGDEDGSNFQGKREIKVESKKTKMEPKYLSIKNIQLTKYKRKETVVER